MSSTFGSLPASPAAAREARASAALSAASVTVPHAVGLGLLAFAPLAGQVNVAALALWSAAVPGALLAVFAGRPGVVHAPTTVVALLFATVVATATQFGRELGLQAPQVLAVAGATVALAFAVQWLFGVLRLAVLARFLPISVTHGFAAGVGLSMVAGQVAHGFGAGGWQAGLPALAWHAVFALGVAVGAVAVQRRWPQMPGLLPAVALAAVAAAVFAGSAPLQSAVPAGNFGWVPWPDWDGVPWGAVVNGLGLKLASLAILMAIVNSLDIVVFNQELELEHGVRGDPDAALRRESLVGVLCALVGLIPASTSASRSRIALAQGRPSQQVGRVHAIVMLLVAATGHLWLHCVPMAALAGALLLAGFNQVPRALWSRGYARAAPAIWAQSWMVALVFASSGGVGALIAGLVVATFVLLHSSASTALRRTHLDGQLRSRRLRRGAAEAWLAGRMPTLAVFELQGVMSFGVAAHLSEQVRATLQPRHTRVILDASRVAAWDATALARLSALARDLGQQGIEAAACGLDEASAQSLGESMQVFADLDRAMEWAEEAMLQDWPQAAAAAPLSDVLGELGEGLSEAGRHALEARLQRTELQPHSQVFASGDTGSELSVVQGGRITMSTAWPPARGMRLATVGRGMAFGEMAFLNGQPRTACAGTEDAPAQLVRLGRRDFEQWAREHPDDGLRFMNNLAQIGARRLAATTRQLRAVLE
ncbi:SLC26A/SulP transporter family protein [Ramlibacter humi]|uniref:Cyclic nucleotide-binding domain-containing protein n=1 Tax=Ramlibacter humi TaxID=2530451 RepID=A0A4Z0BED8_9BURK|nr:SulP family inorganic anion transporter [Ramlibacter humi]TFY97672.1 cyclic nucleotide-binding domain-containing protein [Ramlibacter humi]